MAEREFTKAVNRKAYEQENLHDAEKKRFSEIEQRQNQENNRLNDAHKERYEQDLINARKEILAQRQKQELTPKNVSKTALSREKIELLARNNVQEKNQKQSNELNKQFEKQKDNILDKQFSEERKAIEAMREQKKIDRETTNIHRARNSFDRNR